MRVSDQSSSAPQSASLEECLPNLGTYLERLDGASNFSEGIQFDNRAQDGHDLAAVSGVQLTPNDGFGYFDDNAAGPGPSAAGSEGISQGQERFQYAQGVGGDGGQMEIQKRILVLLDERQRALQEAEEKLDKIKALRKALEVMNE